MGGIREFMERNYRHFNSREVLGAARAWEAHFQAGGKMLVSLAGAMSTAELGLTLAPLIRAGKVHAISCTGANLEEDLFNLLAHDEYEIIPDWRALSAGDEQDLYDRGFNRVTDTCIPEDVMRHAERRLLKLWKKACDEGVRKMPSEFLFDLLGSGELDEHFQVDPADSWLLAAQDAGIPVFSPGWEDSTTGNIFAANVMMGNVPHHQCVSTGTEQFQRVIEWYLENCGGGTDGGTDGGWTVRAGEGAPSVGFFQIGGGIAGDFAICAVPSIIQDLKRETPFWGYFAQITDAPASYGGYSGAVPNEKITWGKLAAETPKFLINSDATIVAPLIFSYLLEREAEEDPARDALTEAGAGPESGAGTGESGG